MRTGSRRSTVLKLDCLVRLVFIVFIFKVIGFCFFFLAESMCERFTFGKRLWSISVFWLGATK